MNSIDIRTGEPGKVDTIIFADSTYSSNSTAIHFSGGEMDFVNADDVDCVDLSLPDADAYNLYLAMNKAFEMGLIKAPAVKAPAAKRVTTPKVGK